VWVAAVREFAPADIGRNDADDAGVDGRPANRNARRGDLPAWKEFDMKILTTLPLAGALLMTIPAAAWADDVAQSSEPSKATMQNNANASAQATTDMSYGGATDTRTSSGMPMMHSRSCSTGPQCNIYFGN
jgi:hypothetical protein